MGSSDHILWLRRHVGHEMLLLPGVSAIIVNEAGEVLLQKSSDNGRWQTLGGAVDPGEEPADAITREVFEETGLRVRPVCLTGVYRTAVVHYSNGDKVQYITTVFRCEVLGGTLRVSDDESLELRFFPPDRLPADLRPDQRIRIEHALSNTPGACFNWNGTWQKNS